MVAFRLLVVFVLVIGFVWFVYKLGTAKEKDKSNNSRDDIQKTISELEIKIRLLEIKARQGIEGAQEELKKNKEDLEEIIKLKEKLKN